MRPGASRHHTVLRCLLSSLLLTLTACGGGGGEPEGPYALSGTVSGLTGGTLVLQVSGRRDVHATANGSLLLASGLAGGGTYSVSVKTQPARHECEVTNGSGTIADADVTNVQITCVAEPVVLGIVTPDNDVLVPLDGTQNVTASFSGTTAGRLRWTVLPVDAAGDVTVTPVSSTAASAVVAFRATAPAAYTLRVSSDDDPAQVAQIVLQVHRVYTAIDGHGQQRTFLRADGRVFGSALSDAPDSSGAPVTGVTGISQGESFRVAVRADGTVAAWATGDDRPGITPAPAGLTGIRQLAAGGYYVTGIRQDGTLVAWGRLNSDLQVPDSLAGTKLIAADTTLSHPVVIREDGTLVTWHGDTGALATLPAAWQGRKFKEVCGTTWHVVAVDEDGAVHSWNPVNTSHPMMNTPPATSGAVERVYCGSGHAALVQVDGRVLTWGEELGGSAFDSSIVNGFPRIKGASLFSYRSPYFLTEGGAVIDVDGRLVRAVDDL